jgi:dTDP-glucose pyrophosphorylase
MTKGNFMRAATTVVITMAGMGQRFRDAGYNIPKYQIVVHGRTLFAWSLISLKSFIDNGSSFVFVVRAEDAAEAFIRSECDELGISTVEIISLDRLTDGQATSALLAEPKIQRPSQPFLIYNIDTHVTPSALPAECVRGDGWIPCFPGPGNGWSFARADQDGRITELREKERISDHATLGLYWFSSFEIFSTSYKQYYSDPEKLEKGEKYVAPLYNHIIQAGGPVYLHQVPLEAVIPLGTPAEVERFRLTPYSQETF